MTPQQMEQVFRRTLEDDRLSGSEKQALATVLTDLAVSDAQRAVYRHLAFDLAREAAADPQARRIFDWLEEVVKVLHVKSPGGEASASEACFTPGSDCPSKIADLFARARRSIDICVFTITDDRIARAVLEAHRRGALVRIITDNEKSSDKGSDIERFIEAKILVRIDQTPFHMHHKFAIFDGGWLLNGSYNWTRSAAEHNKENFVVTSERTLVTAFAREFERMWTDLA